MVVRKGWGSVLFSMVAAVCAASVSSTSRAGTVLFVVAERPGVEEHHDSFVLPLSQDADIAHARDLIARGPEAAGAPIVFASIVAGADGVNRNTLAPGEPLWHWHVKDFEGFGDFGIELTDGWPTFVESDVQGWIRNTTRTDPAVGHIGFWNYTVVAELGSGPVGVPLPAGLITGGAGLAALILTRRFLGSVV